MFNRVLSSFHGCMLSRELSIDVVHDMNASRRGKVNNQSGPQHELTGVVFKSRKVTLTMLHSAPLMIIKSECRSQYFAKIETKK